MEPPNGNWLWPENVTAPFETMPEVIGTWTRPACGCVVRCGILHQGETTRGWQATRENGEPLFDPSTQTLHATKFRALMAKVIDKYFDGLNRSPLTSEVWKRFTNKMQATIKNCEA